jgi:hypothetical protein
MYGEPQSFVSFVVLVQTPVMSFKSRILLSVLRYRVEAVAWGQSFQTLSGLRHRVPPSPLYMILGVSVFESNTCAVCIAAE